MSRCWLFDLFIVFLPFLCEINLQDSDFQVSGRRPQAIRIDCFISSICRLVFLVLHALSSLAKGERLTAWDILNHLLNLVVVLLLQSWCHKMIWTNFVIIFYRSHIRRTFFSYDIHYFVWSNNGLIHLQSFDRLPLPPGGNSLSRLSYCFVRVLGLRTNIWRFGRFHIYEEYKSLHTKYFGRI